MSLLEVKNVSRWYGEFRAVDQVSFSLEAGTILGFIGPNGAGKSTTMRIIATLDLPSEGEVLLGGQSVVDRPDHARPLIGYMPDRYGTYDDITVFEFLDFFARAYGLKGALRTQRVNSVMEFAGLTGLRDKLTSDLSKGMRQRVALGRTLLHDPQLLLLDEPADGLDPRARIELRELLKALAAQGKAVLISSHILTELSEICDSCAIIERGRVLATGPVHEVLATSQGGSAHVDVDLKLLPQTAEASARLERLLLEQPLVTQATVADTAARVRLQLPAGTAAHATWADEACAHLIGVLVKQQVPLCSLSVRSVDLEDAFMSVTKGHVQ